MTEIITLGFHCNEAPAEKKKSLFCINIGFGKVGQLNVLNISQMFRDFHHIKLIWKEDRLKVISASFNISDSRLTKKEENILEVVFSVLQLLWLLEILNNTRYVF